MEDLDNAIQAKAEFSHAIAMMDRIEGWEEVDEPGIWVQDSFRACGSTHKPSFVADRVICKLSGFSG